MGNKWFRFFNFYNAEAITSSGQFAIQYNTQVVDDYVNKVCKTKTINAIYNDTDSIAISLSGIIDKLGVNRKDPRYIDTLCSFVDKHVNQKTAVACETIANGLNVFENRLSFKREKIFLSGLYVAKKRYALLVVDEEGIRFKEPKIKITGLEVKRSDTPKVCRDAMKEVLMIILSGTESELQSFVKSFEDKFKQFAPEEYALPTGVNGLLKYEDKTNGCRPGTPMHVRAALMYNKTISDLGLENRRQLIEEGNKMKYLKLTMPNQLRSNVIGFLEELPPEFQVHGVIDHEAMFEDTFAKGTRRMVEAAGWSMQYVENLEDWF